jgi:ABC-type glycerol-3-phosphate transport system permease component
MAAYAFAWMSFPFRNSLFLVMVALLVVPVQITLIPILRLYADHLTVHITVPLIGGNLFGVSSFPGLWLAHTAFGLPFAVYLLRNFFGSLPRELIESAQLDGASEWQIFRRIILPMISPTIAVVTTTLVIQSLKIFDLIWVTTGGRFQTDVIATLFFKEAFVIRDMGVGSALAVVLLVAVVPVMVISLRRFQFQEETR